MRKANWKEEFLIGIDAIDRQHREIFDRLLALENGIEKRDPWHVLQYLLADLANSLKFHFAVEDAVLEMIAYPQLEQHRQQHARLAVAMTELESKIKKSAVSGDLVGFFEEWFVRHVLGDDRDYAVFVRERLAL